LDRNVLTATVLIAIIMVVWLTWMAPPPPAPNGDEALASDTTTEDLGSQEFVEQGDPDVGSVQELAMDDSTFVPGQGGEVRSIEVENSLYRAVLSTQGGTFTSLELKEYTVAGA